MSSTAYTDPNSLLEEHARRRPDKVFVESVDQGERITFGAFESLTRRFAQFLAREGVRAGDRISVLADNAIAPLVVFWGALRSGVIVNPINVEIREQHVGRILRDVAPALVFHGPQHAALAAETGGATWIPLGAWRAPAPGGDDLFARLRTVPEAALAVRPARGDWSCLNYTSGTTDVPKGAIWTHEAYYAMSESTIDRLELGEVDTILDYRHFSWSSPQILSIGPAMLTGATLVLARHFSCAATIPGQRRLGSIGRPTLNMRVRLLDDDGREVGPGEDGEMVVSGRQMASAYWQGPGQLVPIPQDGFPTGDLARRDEDGYLPDAGRTSSSREASTSPHSRPRTACLSTPTWPTRRPSASRTRSTARCWASPRCGRGGARRRRSSASTAPRGSRPSRCRRPC